jgi:methionine aminopeptidase
VLRLALYVAAAVIIGVIAPRRRPLALLVFAALLTLGGLSALLHVGNTSIIVGALAAFGLLASLLLARALPRLFVFLLLLVAVALSGFSPPSALLDWQRIALLVAVAAVAAALAFRADLGMRVAGALLGGRCLALFLHGDVPAWQRAALAAAVFAATTVLPGRRSEQPAPGLAATTGMGASLSILLGIALLTSWMLAPVLPAAGSEIFSSRLQRLKAEAPRGGLLWALPSESIFWGEDASSFPRIENLDAIWLGAPPRILYKLDGTSIFGRLGLHGAAARLREIKDASEIAQLRLAARAIVESVRENLRLYRPGAQEADIARAILESARRRGCAPESFPPIVASGPSAAKPHGSGNERALKAGELVMTDVGCYSAHYASDFTRTIPVQGGKFTDRQRKVYQAVYEAQQAALKECRPGARLRGGLDGIARAVIKAKGFEDHNPFGIGHTVGLFVHDVTSRRELAPGMVITLEPGIYQPKELGVRIEDEYLVTEKGCELLTEGFPADPDSVQALMSAAPQ